jgi:hypothetical protein
VSEKVREIESEVRKKTREKNMGYFAKKIDTDV